MLTIHPLSLISHLALILLFHIFFDDITEGRGNCSRFFLTGEKFDAAEATRIGLIQGHFETIEQLDEKLNTVLKVSLTLECGFHACFFMFLFRKNHMLTHEAHTFQQEIKNNSPAAMRTCKQLISNVYLSLGTPKTGEGLSDLKQQLASEIARIRVSKEGQEGLSAFLEKRKPSWIQRP